MNAELKRAAEAVYDSAMDFLGKSIESLSAEALRLLEERNMLLAALRDLVTDDTAFRDRFRPEYQERLEAARAAIAKAEGKP